MVRMAGFEEYALANGFVGEFYTLTCPSPDFSPGSRMLAQDSHVWTPLWNESGSRSYHLSEEPVLARENQPGPG